MGKDLKERMIGILQYLTDEQKEKMKACKSPDQIIALLSKMGVELPDELLDTVAGGAGNSLFERLLASVGVQGPEQEPDIPRNPY